MSCADHLLAATSKSWKQLQLHFACLLWQCMELCRNLELYEQFSQKPQLQTSSSSQDGSFLHYQVTFVTFEQSSSLTRIALPSGLGPFKRFNAPIKRALDFRLPSKGLKLAKVLRTLLAHMCLNQFGHSTLNPNPKP